MAIVAVSKLIKDSQMWEDINGLTVVDVYLVDQLSGDNILYDALTFGGLPVYGQPHAQIPNIFVAKRTPVAFAENSKTQVKVLIEYRPPDYSNLNLPIISATCTTQEVTTNFDSDGALITVDYTPSGGNKITTVGQVRATKSLGILTYDYITYSDPTFLFNAKNTINNTPWWGEPKYTWFCAVVQIQKVLYRAGWKVHLEFRFDEETFVKTAVYRDRAGFVPKDIDSPVDKSKDKGNGWTNVKVQGQMDFNGLNLPQRF